jgi:hypothetical protein
LRSYEKVCYYLNMIRRSFVLKILGLVSVGACSSYIALFQNENDYFRVDTSLTALKDDESIQSGLYSSQQYFEYKEYLEANINSGRLIQRSVVKITPSDVMIEDVWKSREDYLNYKNSAQVKAFVGTFQSYAINMKEAYVKSLIT